VKIRVSLGKPSRWTSAKNRSVSRTGFYPKQMDQLRHFKMLRLAENKEKCPDLSGTLGRHAITTLHDHLQTSEGYDFRQGWRDNAFDDSHRFDMMRASLTVVRGSSKLIVSIGHGICSDGDARANALAPAAVDGLSFEVVLASLWVTINN